MEETFPHKIRNFAYITDNGYTVEQVKLMEV